MCLLNGYQAEHLVVIISFNPHTFKRKRNLRFGEITGLTRMFKAALVPELNFNPCPNLKWQNPAMVSLRINWVDFKTPSA